MQLGVHMRELWRHKVGLAIAFVLAVLAATRILYGISFFPPSLEPNSLGLASASTHVLVDTPRSSLVDLREDTYSFTELTNRALLLGNVMASLPVRDYIARHAGVPADLIKVAPPLTPEQPRALATSGEQPKSSDILKSPNEYRLSVQSNPTVPIIDIDSEAPSAAAAAKLANAAVEGLRDYLLVTAKQRATPTKDQVRLVQLGRATGAAINAGAGIQFAVLAFIFVFAACCAVVLFIGRVRRGWVASEGLDSRPLSDST
jgi:hypothetical protein